MASPAAPRDAFLPTPQIAPLSISFVDPFRHFVAAEFFPPSLAPALLAAIRSQSDWEMQSTVFYDHWSIILHEREKAPATPLAHPALAAMMGHARAAVATHFGEPLSQVSQLMAHRMERGHRIEVHNDAPPLGYEGYRMLAYLDSPPAGEGRLNLHADAQTDAVRSFTPMPGLAVGMALSPTSYHSVDGLTDGARTALVFNFWHAGNSPAIERAVKDHIERLRGDAANPAMSQLNLLLAMCRAVDDAKRGVAAHLAALTYAEFGADPVERDALLLAIIGVRFWGQAAHLAGEATCARALAIAAALKEDAASLPPALLLAEWIGFLPNRIFNAGAWAERAVILREQQRRQRPDIVHWIARLFSHELA